MDAGFIRESALHAVDKYISPGFLTPVAECAWLPNRTLSVKRSIPDEKRAAIKDAVLWLKDGALSLRASESRGYGAPGMVGAVSCGNC